MTTTKTKTDARAVTTEELDLDAMLDEAAIAMQRVSAAGRDTKSLSTEERVALLASLNRALGLNPLVNGVQFLTLQGREVLYVTKHATDQIASRLCLNRETIAGPDIRDFGGTKLVFCQVRVSAPNGRSEVATATLPVSDLVNVLMKAETKAKRRATLSIAGLGLLSEDETETIPGATPSPVAQSTPRAATPSVSLDALGVEQRKHAAPKPSTPHDPETGEVVESPAPPADAVPGVVADVERRAAECGSADDLAAVWRERQADLRAAGKGLTMAAWRHVVARCADLGIAPGAVSALVKAADSVRPAADDLGAAEEQLRAAGDAAALAQGYAAASALLPQHAAGLWSLALSLAARAGADETTLRRMVLDRGGTVPDDGPEKGPSGPQGGRKGARGGKPADARGDAREGAANDGATALDLTRVSDAAEGILSRHGGNAFALRASIRKHAAELRADDVAVLADALARVTPADEHGARLTREGASAIVRGLLGLRRAA